MLLALLIVIASLLVLAGAGAGGVALRRAGAAETVVYAGAAVLSAVGLVLALSAIGGAREAMVLPVGLPWLQAHLRLDGLGACFLAIVNLVALFASVYALGYARQDPAFLPFYPAFLAGMNLVPLADDAFSFLMAWEFMSASSWFLVVGARRDEATRRAGYLYLLMAAFGTLVLLLAFGVMAGVAGDYRFEAIRARELSPGLATLAAGLVLLGAGSKAGVIPVHAWLPPAHAAAPSHVSALLSGAMTKIAVYALVRLLFDLVQGPAWWWGLVLMLVGAGTAVLGILQALFHRDLKTVLAFSTIENIGVIVTALGLALAFRSNGLDVLAGLALTAAILHALNHATFKSLLFFGAGMVLSATGLRDLERLGGLLRRMPTTGAAMLVACFAAAALPPLNGFVSEWLLFQAVLNGPLLAQWGLKLTVPVVGVLLALAAALAATCFVRVFGIAFLGRPRSDEAAGAVEGSGTARTVLLAAAALCVLLGALPALALQPLASAVQEFVAAAPVGDPGWLLLMPVAGRGSSYSGVVILLVLAMLGVLVAFGARWVTSGRIRRAPLWDCGFPIDLPQTQYGADSFAQPLRRILGGPLLHARERVDMPDPGDPRPGRFEAVLRDPVWDWLYAPIGAGVARLTDLLDATQFLTIRKYLSLMFGALVLLLIIVAAAR